MLLLEVDYYFVKLILASIYRHFECFFIEINMNYA